MRNHTTAFGDLDLEAFSREMLRRRLEKGLTQTDLGKLTGLSIASISHLERAKYPPSLRSLHALARIYRLSFADVLALLRTDKNTATSAHQPATEPRVHPQGVTE